VDSPLRCWVSYRLRVGTFNVNGKLPSQDLAGWVGGRRGDGVGFLPPVTTLSPLEVGLDKILGSGNLSNSDYLAIQAHCVYRQR
jgi:hypothetical protein